MRNVLFATPRKLYSLPGLNNSKFKGRDNDEIRMMIESDVCHYFDVPAEMISNKSQQGKYAEARHIIMYLLVHYTSYSLKDIGSFYGRNHHTTVRAAKEKIKGFLDPRFSTADAIRINKFLYRFGYKEKEVQREPTIDHYY